MTEAILKRISLEVLERLNEKDQAEYEKLIDENAAPEELEKFLREKISDYDIMIKKTIADFTAEMKKTL
jgi:hypothetical protein